jgi:hypothetical protein
LPGIASKVNRAATSAMRPAPLVMTMNQEDDEADDVVALDDEVAERLDDVAGVAVEQDQPRGSDVERQPVKRDEQQQRGESGKFCRGAQVKNDQQRQQRKPDADGQQQVQQHRRHRQDQQQNRAKQRENQPQIAVAKQLSHPVTQGSHASFLIGCGTANTAAQDRLAGTSPKRLEHCRPAG